MVEGKPLGSLRIGAIASWVLLGSMLGPAKARPQTTNPRHLAQFPSTSQVRAELKGSDPVDSSARVMAAWMQLQGIIKTLSGPRAASMQYTPDESSLTSEYGSAWQRGLYLTNLPPEKDRARWNQLRAAYEKDPAFLDLLLQRFFPVEFRLGYYRAIGKPPPGGVAANPAPAVSAGPAPAPSLSAPTVRFDGLYRTADAEYLRFYEDGTVIGARFRGEPKEVARVLKKPYRTTGHDQIKGATIEFSLVSQDRVVDGVPVKGGTVSYTGTVATNSLTLQWRATGVTGGVYKYEFVPVPDLAKPD